MCASRSLSNNDFNEKGFLGEEIQNFQQSVLEKYIKLFDLVRQLNLYAQGKKFDLAIDPDNGQQVLSISLLTKILNDLQSVYVLCTYGLTQQSRIILRSTLESFFLLAKLVTDPSIVTQYINADIINRLNIMKTSHKYHGPLFTDIQNIATHDKIQELEKQKKSENIKPLKIESIAQSIGLGAYYDSVYRILSQDVHSQVRSLKQYVSTGVEDEIQNMEWGPREEDVPTCLAIGVDVATRSWMAIDEFFKLGIQSKLYDFLKDLEIIQQELNSGVSLTINYR